MGLRFEREGALTHSFSGDLNSDLVVYDRLKTHEKVFGYY
jgi:hypothetical protein